MYILFKDEFPIDKVMIIDLISIIHVIFWSLHILGGGGGSKLVRQEVKDLPLFARKERGFVCQPNLKCVVIAGIGWKFVWIQGVSV